MMVAVAPRLTTRVLLPGWLLLTVQLAELPSLAAVAAVKMSEQWKLPALATRFRVPVIEALVASSLRSMARAGGGGGEGEGGGGGEGEGGGGE
jgi:uncharacterized membrane protein YgcG